MHVYLIAIRYTASLHAVPKVHTRRTWKGVQDVCHASTGIEVNYVEVHAVRLVAKSSQAAYLGDARANGDVDHLLPANTAFRSGSKSDARDGSAAGA